MSDWKMPRESLEWVGPLTVSANGVPTLTYQVSLVKVHERPKTFLPPDPLAGGLGLLVGPGGTWAVEPGTYTIWVKITSAGEAPVLDTTGNTIYIT
jgi:hypothetical protein